MDTGLIVSIVTIVILLACSGFFSGSETALMASSKPKLHNMRKNGDKGAERILAMLADVETLLSTILLGNNLVNIGASALATAVFIKLFGEIGVVAATVVMTVLVLIFSEVLPKTIASRQPEKFSGVINLPLWMLIKFLRPCTRLIAAISRGLMRLIGINPDEADPNFGEEDLRGAIGMGRQHGLLNKREFHMLDSILDLDELTVEDVMTHRSNMETLDINQPTDQIYLQISNSSFSRLPVWEGEPENIIGILHVRDFYTAYHKALGRKEAFDIRKILQKPYFTPETARLASQLLQFRKNRRHMSIVVNEYGEVEGLVTLEDILEEIVGEIEDEHDIIAHEYARQADGSVLLNGTFPVRDANKELGFDLPDEDSVTIAGLIIEQAQRIPVKGEVVNIGGISFEIVATKRNAILRVKAHKIVKTKKQAKEEKQA